MFMSFPKVIELYLGSVDLIECKLRKNNEKQF
jgi:hypothetical protein